MTELAVLGSSSKLTAGSLNQNTEGKLGQEETSLFAALFQGLTLTSASQEQLPNLAQDTAPVDEILAELYSLMQPSQLSLEDAVANFQGLSADKQQEISQALADLLTNQSNTVQAGQLKGFGFSDIKAPKTNYEQLALSVQEQSKQGNSSKLNAEINVQKNITFNQLGNPDSSYLSRLDLSNLNSPDLNQDIAKSNNGELATVLKALFNSEQTTANKGTEESNTLKVEGSQGQEQKGYSNYISNLLNNSSNQPIPIKSNEIVEGNNSTQNIDAEVLDLAKAELQPLKLNVKSDLDGSEATNKQANIEHLATNRNFTEELGKIMIKSFKLPDGASETKIQMHPQELGQIDVKLVANNGQISAQLIAETALGKELLEGQINQLKQSLIQQGYQVDRIEVQQAPQSSNLNNDFKGSSSFNFAGQNSSRQFTRENPNHKYSNFSEDIDEFVQEMLNVTGIDYTV